MPELSYVYHGNKGVVYPKEVNVTISIIVLHDYPLGFGGPRRPGEPLKWAENENRDWPHGTGPTYPVPSYVSKDEADLGKEDSEVIETETEKAWQWVMPDDFGEGKELIIGPDGELQLAD